MYGDVNVAGESLPENQDSTGPIHLALSVWDMASDYNRHAGVTIASFLDQCSGSRVEIHLLYEEYLSEKNPQDALENRQRYADLCNKPGVTVSFHPISLPAWVDELPAIRIFTRGTLLRLFLPDILPDISKIIYLDCDVVVNMDIRELWDIDITDVPLATPQHMDMVYCPLSPAYYRSLNTTAERYFNAGVLLMNLSCIRRLQGSLSESALKFLSENKNTPYLDQDALNKFFGATYLQIPKKYNIMIGTKEAVEYGLSGILHYSGTLKPWKAYRGEVDDLYWHYLLKTPWGKDPKDILSYIQPIPNLSAIRSHGFHHLYDLTGYPYLTLMKMIFVSVCSLTKCRVRAFLRYHVLNV